MAATTCECDPRNLRLCCDKTCCSLDSGLNGNRVVELTIRGEAVAPPSQSPGPLPPPDWTTKSAAAARPAHAWTPPALVAVISHVAGCPAAFCDVDKGACTFLSGLCKCVLLLPWILPGVCVLYLLRACLVIHTTLHLHAEGGAVHGVVTRRSGCCTWRIRVEGVEGVRSEEVADDSEAPARLFLHASSSSGAAKVEVEVSEGPVPGLDVPVNAWIAGGRGAPAS